MQGSILAQTVTLDFGASSVPDFHTASGLEMRYSGVAAGINASIVSSNPFNSKKPENHGSVIGAGNTIGDARINTAAEVNLANISTFTLSLWDASSGDGYSTPYSNVNSYEWTLGFYDIDSGDPSGANYTWDYIRVHTEGEYTISTASNILVDSTSMPGSVSFSGENVGVVAGQDGLSSPYTADQINSTVLYTFTDKNSIQFDYAADRNSGNGGQNGRNALINGGSINDIFDGVSTVTVPVPEPTSIGIMGIQSLRKNSSAKVHHSS